MEYLKSFISHFFAILFYFALIFITLVMLSKELINHDNIYQALEKSNFIDKMINSDEPLLKANVPENVIKYVKIDDILYNYITDDFLFEAKIIDQKPILNQKELNSRLAKGIERYIDDQVDEYANNTDYFIENSDFDLRIRDKIEAYIESKESIDLSNDYYIDEDSLSKISSSIDKSMEKIKDDSFIFDITAFIYNDNYYNIAIMIIIFSLLIIGLVNFNIINIFSYTIAPFVIAAIFYISIYLIASNLNFNGGLIADTINLFKTKLATISLRYSIVLFAIAVLVCIIYFIIKRLNIAISHKKGVTTLDTVLDDYNRDDIVKQINDEDNPKEEKKDNKKEKKKKGKK